MFLRREHRYDEALPIVRSLVPRFPQDVLLALEEGHLLRAAGRISEAAEVYRRIWQAGKEGKYPGLHYEIAALSLGDLLRSQKDYGGAAAAYELVGQAPQPDSEALQKANLGAGEMYDLLQKRDWRWPNIRRWSPRMAASASAEIGAQTDERGLSGELDTAGTFCGEGAYLKGQGFDFNRPDAGRMITGLPAGSRRYFGSGGRRSCTATTVAR